MAVIGIILLAIIALPVIVTILPAILMGLMFVLGLGLTVGLPLYAVVLLIGYLGKK